MGISPDSWYHLRVSQEYAKTLSIPPNTPDTYQWRDITHIPYLYFWINGRILNINSLIFHFNDVILLRIINIIYSLLTIYGIYLLSKEVIKSKWGRIIPVILVCNTLMFVFLSSSINYDNLANMFATYSIYFFILSITRKGNIQYPLLTILMLCLGTLTKYTILPLAAIIVVLLIYEIVKDWNIWKDTIKNKWILLTIPVLIVGILNITLYGNNILKYRELIPSCEKILSNEECLENGVYLRDNIWIPKEEINFVESIFSGKRLDPIRYSGIWMFEMTRRVTGFMGDQNLFHSDTTNILFISLFSISVVIGIFNWKKYSKAERYLIYITIFYTLVLMLLQNYTMYLDRGYIILTLQGRYIFPVISSIYTIFSKTLLNINNKKIRNVLISLAIILTLLSCIPFLVLNVDPNWFGYIYF